ncbi:MAG: translation initiation factor IF-2, partial [Desulfobacterales bacterium]
RLNSKKMAHVSKKKKEAAAKIIKLPVSPKPKVPEVEEIKDKKRSKKPERTDVAIKKKPAVLSPPAEQVEAKKKTKKRAEEPVKDKKFFKKKISFRRKEVVEGAALYTQRQRTRKTRKGAKGKIATPAQKPQITVPKAIKRKFKIDETIILSDLAKRMGIKAVELIKELMSLGVIATVNQTVDFDTAALVAAEFDYEVEKASFEEESLIKIEEDDPGKLVLRPPVVTIMGHVDHGKTSLLDVIRKSRVTDSEAGGITQHIGAYFVSTKKGQIVFLDTPGHEAFTAMRARGANVTDLVVLVVAADDGVMPQTIEAINHSKAAEVPIIVAINKIDKPNADPERVRRELSEAGLMAEDWGGDTIFLEVSAKENQGIDDLLEMILLQAELLELKANPEKLARGHVIEAKLDAGRGPVATVLIKDGTLHAGESVVCGIHHGKVRAILNERNIQIEKAGPSIPAKILGLSGVPMAGDELIALPFDKSAKQVSMFRSQKQRSKNLSRTSRLSLEKLHEKMLEGEIKDLNLIIKADVQGSIEALSDSLTRLSNEEVKINVIHSATGGILESDVFLAAGSYAIIIGFNVRPGLKVADLAHEENVDIRFYDVIYNVIKEIKDAIVGMMASTFEERNLGMAEIREVFHIPKAGAIAGCYVTNGKIERGQRARIVRDGVVGYDGKISSLRRFKDDAKEVQTGYECGIGIENYHDFKIGDTIECYYLEEIKPKFE